MAPDLTTQLLHAAAHGRPVPVWAGFAAQLAVALLVFGPLISGIAMLGIWAERKISARIQSRVGPNRVGPFGLWQSLADGAKLLMKEDLIPDGADGWLFRLAPYLAFVPVFAAFAAVPFGPELTFEPKLSAGVFWLLAILSVEVIGVILAGWASNNKWSVYGGVREACQMVCYEVPLGLSIIIGVMTAGTLSLGRLGLIQGGGRADVARVPQPVRGWRRSSVYFVTSAWRPTSGPRSICPRASRSWSRDTTRSTAGCGSACSSSPSTPACSSWPAIQTALYLGGWNDPFGLIGFYHARSSSGGAVGPLLALNVIAAAVFVTKCVAAGAGADVGAVDVPPAADRSGVVRLREGAAAGRVRAAAGGGRVATVPARAGGRAVGRLPAVGGGRLDGGTVADPAWVVQAVLGGGRRDRSRSAVLGLHRPRLRATGRADHRRLFEAEPITA